MNANDVIESYVHDVAVHLPRKQRNDVAFELRALLQEGLQDRADAAGREGDAALALEICRAFGRPADVAARYRPTLTIVDPADGHAFLRAAVIGVAVLGALGLLARLRQPIASFGELLGVLGQWWVTTLNLSLWWLGLLVAGFGLAAWGRRRSPQSTEWKPPAADRSTVSRAGMAMGLIGILCAIFVLLDPRRVLDVFWGGRAAPAAYEALTYTETFRHRQAPLLLALLLLNIPLLLTVIVKGRRSTGQQKLEIGLSLVLCATLVWTMLDGPVFVAPSGDLAAKAYLGLIVAFVLIGIGVKLRRKVRPAPSEEGRA